MGELKRKIIQYNDEKLGSILRKKSVDIQKIDANIKQLFQDLKTLASKSTKGITLVGLSAPQIGENLNAFIYMDMNTRKYIEVINPKITYASKELSVEWEGCASIGTAEKSLFAPVWRPKTIQMQYLDLDGKEHTITASNYTSHIILHEIDHLEGKLFLDRVDLSSVVTAKELDQYAKKHDGNYPKIK